MSTACTSRPAARSSCTATNAGALLARQHAGAALDNERQAAALSRQRVPAPDIVWFDKRCGRSAGSRGGCGAAATWCWSSASAGISGGAAKETGALVVETEAAQPRVPRTMCCAARRAAAPAL
jgi:hypothetical protein